MTQDLRTILIRLCIVSGLIACTKSHALESQYADHWAINYGGEQFVSESGVVYLADTNPKGIETGRIDKVNGVQEPELFQTYRFGSFSESISLSKGYYDITFYFIEPEDVPVGQRLFDIKAQGRVVMSDVDVRKLRDGNIQAGLTHTIRNTLVDDGNLKIELLSDDSTPVISAIRVRKAQSANEKWQLVWSDDFDQADSLDKDKWSIDVWPRGKVNREDQAYTAEERNLRVENGYLVIEAHKEKEGYSSGRIHTMNKADLLYGRVDVRAKLPAGQGTWSAIWMLPSDPYKYASTCKPGEDIHGSHTCNAWPNSGEIDIMEHVGYDMNRVHGTVHTKAYYWVNGQQRKASIDGVDVADEFHVYSLEWSPERIDILMDDTLYFTYLNEGEGWEAWPFDHPYHVILNLAIGGDWGRAGGPIDDSIFPVQMLVDYVRLYKVRK